MDGSFDETEAALEQRTVVHSELRNRNVKYHGQLTIAHLRQFQQLVAESLSGHVKQR